MDENKFKKLLDDALRPALDEALEPVKKTLKEHTTTLKTLVKRVGKLESSVDTLSSSVVSMEDTIKIYGDMYKINNDNDRKLEKRVITLEDNAGIEPPPELILLKVQ